MYINTMKMSHIKRVVSCRAVLGRQLLCGGRGGILPSWWVAAMLLLRGGWERVEENEEIDSQR